MGNVRRDIASGTLLIAGSLAMVAVMALHPTGQELQAGGPGSGMLQLGVLVHGAALAVVPVLFLGLLGFTRRLGPSDLTTAALVAFGFGAVAVLSAGVMSGFVATWAVEGILTAEGETREVYRTLLRYTGQVNHGFAGVHVVATASAILLWSTAILRSRRAPRSAGIAGLIIGAGVLAGFLSGVLSLDVHGFGLIILAQSVWFIWLGILLLRRGGPEDSSQGSPVDR